MSRRLMSHEITPQVRCHSVQSASPQAGLTMYWKTTSVNDRPATRVGISDDHDMPQQTTNAPPLNRIILREHPEITQFHEDVFSRLVVRACPRKWVFEERVKSMLYYVI